ncbi:MAG TPA: PAS domain-containing protein [Alphaproteobacteria bacterium]|nr:PAS domain-containing protein [Alphaproteobacteria bacterium]
MALAIQEAASGPAVDVSGWHSNLHALYRYWGSIHRPVGLPSRQDIDPTAIPALLPRIWILDVQPEPFRLRHRLVGTRIVELVGEDFTGRWADEAHPHLAIDPSPLRHFRGVAKSGVPTRRRGKPQIFLKNRAEFAEVETAIFPLAGDGKIVDALLCCTIFYRRNGAEF